MILMPDSSEVESAAVNGVVAGSIPALADFL